VRPFGNIETKGWKLLEFESEDDLEDWIIENRCEVFVNHTYGSFMANPADIGLYVVMFPQVIGELEKENLATYNLISCISQFTESYVKLRWGNDLTTEVIVPPISSKG